MGDDEIGDMEGLDLGFVAVEEFLTDSVRAVITGGIGLPRDVRSGQQIEVHRIAENGFVEPLRHASEGVIEPDFRYD